MSIKKLSVVLLSLLLCMTAVTAYATEYSPLSITTTDLVEVVKLVEKEGVEYAPDFSVDIVEPKEEVIVLAAKIAAFVSENNVPPVEYLPEEVKTSVASLLKQDETLDQMTLDEFIPVNATNYDPDKYGDVEVLYSFTTKYQADQTIVALLSVITGAEADGTPITDWLLLNATVQEDGTVAVTYTPEAFELLKKGPAVLVILSGEASAQ